MKFLLPMFISLILSMPSLGQTLLDILDPTTTANSLLRRSEGNIENPYLFNDFVESELFLKSKDTPVPALINIDIYGQEIVTKLDSKEVVLNKQSIKFLVVKVNKDSSSTFDHVEDDFLLVINKNHQNNTQLYKKFGKKIIKGNQGNGYIEATKDRLVDSENYILIVESRKLSFTNSKELIKKINEFWPNRQIDTNFKKIKIEINRIRYIVDQL
jgi:hypothetical protein